MSKRPAQAHAYLKTGGKAPRRQLENAAKRTKHTEGAVSAVLNDGADKTNKTIYDSLKNGADGAVRALHMYTLHGGTNEQVNEQVEGFYSNDEGQRASLAYNVYDDEDIPQEMKAALEKLEVPAERCFFKNKNLPEQANLYDFWEASTEAQKSVARLAWLMEEDDE